MEEFFKSANRLWWAISLLGMQQIGNALLPSPSRRPGARERTGSSGNPFGRAFGDIYPLFIQLQEQTFHVLSSIFPMDTFTPRRIMKAAIELMQDSADMFRGMTPPGDGQIAWRELQNKLQSFYLFEHIDSVLSLPADLRPALHQLLDKVSRLGSFLSVWGTEGLGHYYSNWQLSRGSPPRQLLCSRETQDLPLTSLVPLHTGMGLSLAEFSLSATDESFADIGALISSFIELCQNNARKDFFGEAYEAFGLTSRNLYPHLVEAIDLRLSQVDDALLGYFWHGVGRAIYFAPTNFPPFRSAPWRALEMCFQEPSHALGQRNAVAGFAWALTLVNMRQPEVMATFLKHHQKDIAGSDAFDNGVCSAALIWHNSAPHDADLGAFRDYEPDKSDPSLAELWNKYVRQNCNDALRYHPIVTRRRALQEVFRYQNLPQFVRTLESSREDFNGPAADA